MRMGIPLRVLIVKDSEDPLLVLRELWRGGYDPFFKPVETPEAMAAELERETGDIVISENLLPRFTRLGAPQSHAEARGRTRTPRCGVRAGEAKGGGCFERKRRKIPFHY
jgi:hypothetical protein